MDGLTADGQVLFNENCVTHSDLPTIIVNVVAVINNDLYRLLWVVQINIAVLHFAIIALMLTYQIFFFE